MVSQLPLDVAGLVSVWLEGMLYGIYCSLFFESVYIVLKRNMVKTGPSKIFFGGTILMFVVATTHIALNLYRLLRGYVWLADSVGPTNYFLDLGRWDNIAHDAVNAIMTWIADFLIIYRCFIVWNNNLYVVILPACLLIMSIIANSIALKLFTKVPLGTIFGPTLKHWMNAIYALAFVQNVMTTGLIAYRIWRQERESIKVGIHTPGSRSSLMPIIRIVIESAMIYVVELVILIILYALNHNGQFVLQEAVVPTVGIVFTLMTVRIAMRGSRVLNATTEQSRGIRWRARSAVVTTECTTTTAAGEVIDMKPIDTFQQELKYEVDDKKSRGLVV